MQYSRRQDLRHFVNQHPKSLQTPYIPNIPHSEHTTSPTSRTPNITNPQRPTSPISHIPNIHTSQHPTCSICYFHSIPHFQLPTFRQRNHIVCINWNRILYLSWYLQAWKSYKWRSFKCKTTHDKTLFSKYDEYYSSMIASYKMKCHHICSSPVLTKNLVKIKHQSHSLCSTIFTPNSVLIPILMSSGKSDLVSILISFMFSCGLQLSKHFFLVH